MLKEKSYNANDIVSVVLATGQELITKFVSEDINGATIRRPLILAVGPDGNASFQPFSFTGDSEGEVTVRSTQVVAIMKSRGEISQAYSAATSGLVVPNSGLIRG